MRQLRELAKQSEDADQVRRLLALAVVYDGGSRSDGARAGGVFPDVPGLGSAVQWCWPGRPGERQAPGQPPRLDQAQRGELAQLVEEGPIPAVHGVVRWRLSNRVFTSARHIVDHCCDAWNKLVDRPARLGT